MSNVSDEKREWLRRALGVELPEGGPGGAAPGRGTAPDATAAGTEAGTDDGADMEAFLQAALKDNDWLQAAQILNGYPAGALKARLAKFAEGDVARLHKLACDTRSLGPSSDIALATEALSHPVLGSQQAGRAAAAEKKLAPEDQKKYRALLDAAKSPGEKQYIAKGLAANHTVAELEAFAKKIAGKDARWLQDNLSLTGQSDGKGVRQQWHDSCGPTTFEAVQGELDPLYALKKHEDNAHLTEVNASDGKAVNPQLAADQKKILGDAGGIAVNRDQRGGRGMWIAGALNNVSASTGVKYELKKIGDGATLDEGVTALNEAAAEGVPVPISVGNGPKDFHHYVLVTASDPGPPRYYSIHDPWDGKTVIRSEEQLRNGKLDIAGCNDFESFDKPTPVEVG